MTNDDRTSRLGAKRSRQEEAKLSALCAVGERRRDLRRSATRKMLGYAARGTALRMAVGAFGEAAGYPRVVLAWDHDMARMPYMPA